MIQQTHLKFVLNQGWGDYKTLWFMKHELGKAYNGYLEKGDLVWQEVREGSMADKDGNDLIPFMRIPYMFDMQGLVDALTQEKPAKIEVETLSELKATKYHLEDMRKLIFKKDEQTT